jgi:FMN phosphatase YigB (HAD superfamily)
MDESLGNISDDERYLDVGSIIAYDNIRMHVKTIFFDLDGTLVWVPGNGQADWFSQSVRKLGISLDREALTQAYRKAQQRWQREIRPHLGFSTPSFVEWNRLILHELGLDGNLTEIAEEIQRYWESPADQLFTEVPKELERLRHRGIQLGVVSHRPMAGIEHTLRRHGLTEFFRWRASPDSTGVAHGKLDRALWGPLLKAAGVHPEEALHVGDDFETDVRGARRAGLHAVWIERPELTDRFFPGRLGIGVPDDAVPPHEHPCARVASLRELTDLIK